MTENYTSIYRVAVREALVGELQRAIRTIEDATHVATWDGNVSAYGTLAEMNAWVDGLWMQRAAVRPMTREDKELQITHKCRVYRTSRKDV